MKSWCRNRVAVKRSSRSAAHLWVAFGTVAALCLGHVAQPAQTIRAQAGLHEGQSFSGRIVSPVVPAAVSLIREYEFPTPKGGPSIINVDGKDGIWVAMARAGKIGHLRGGELREYALPANSFPVGVATDGAGGVWYSDIRRNKIGRLDSGSGEVKDFAVPTKDSWPFSLAFDRNGMLWFTERVGNKIGRLDPATGEVKEFDVPSQNCQPAGLAVTPDGQIFFTENSGHKIGHLNPKTGQLLEYKLPTPMIPSLYYGLAGITSDKQGNIWFAVLDGRLGHIRRRGPGYEEIKEIALPTPSTRPAGIAVDAWGIVWFTELDGNSISSYNDALGEFRRYPIPTGSPDLRPMGPPEVTARGEMPVPGNSAKTSRPFGIAVDSKGEVWFSEQYAHKVGKLSPPPVEIFQPAATVSGTTAPLKVQMRSVEKHDLKYFVDGKPIPAGHQLDLTLLSPGSHTFQVFASRGGRQAATASSTFNVVPTLETVRELLGKAARSGELDAATLRKLRQPFQAAQMKIAEGKTDVARQQLRQMLKELSHPAQSGDGLRRLMLENLRYLDRFGKRTYQVEITDRPPYFSPHRITVEVGDTVTWVFKDPGRKSGQSSQKASVLSARNAEFNSPALVEGETWSHTFSQEGEYEYLDKSNIAARGSVFVTTRTTEILEFPMLGPDRVPGVLAVDAQDNIWFTAGGGGFSRLAAVPLNNKIGKLSPDGKITEFETPTIESGPTSIHVGREGHIWFTERGGNKLGELDPATGKIKEYEIPSPMSAATGITVDPEGRVWYAAKMSSKIGVLDPATGQIKEYATPTPKSQPSTITYDHDGNIWFDERASDKIVRLNPKTGEMREYAVPTHGSRTVGLVPDKRGHVWFLELGANKVGRLEVETGAVVEYAIPTKYSSPFKLTLDSYGRVWFTQAFGNKIGVLHNDRFYEFAIPTAESMPGGIATDSKGNIWFTEQAGNKIGLIPLAANIPPDAFGEASAPR